MIGETAKIGDNCSIMQGVTLGGTGKETGDRHPKISKGVLIGPNATILGNIRVGRGAMIAAGSLVLKSVPDYTMVAGSVLSDHEFVVNIQFSYFHHYICFICCESLPSKVCSAHI